ncbi:hypothetical protein CC78DRAFT_586460 [Lojkania enalia]|uniref:Uncharacterized protein n=1 Tax=Lojkania enalia TaxID=147567 RepID=A0A9P4MVH7_9PLEO|nr:hypothetical protein CC78DRAFT_586460 [Didymosphaeria enalia]
MRREHQELRAGALTRAGVTSCGDSSRGWHGDCLGIGPVEVRLPGVIRTGNNTTNNNNNHNNNNITAETIQTKQASVPTRGTLLYGIETGSVPAEAWTSLPLAVRAHPHVKYRIGTVPPPLAPTTRNRPR